MARRSKPINADVPISGAPLEAPAPSRPEPATQELKTVDAPAAGASADDAPAAQASADDASAAQASAGAPPRESPPRPPAAAAGPRRPPGPDAPRRRRPIPTALKAIGALVVVAIVFIVAAIVGGGGDDGSAIPGAAPTPDQGRGTPAPEPAAQQAESTGGPEELGYPGFATNNTTRVGGPDPFTNAAAVALAVYPSTRPAQRPKAVTFVDAADWQTALAASVLMADPVRAPLLISEGDAPPEASAEAFEALAPAGGKATGGVQAFAVGGAAVADGAKTRAVRGTGAAGAAAIAALREQLAGAPPRHLLVAPSDPAFAMPAAAWAARSGDPILYSRRDRLPKPTARFIEGHRKVPIFVLGPSSRISSAAVREIAKLGGRVGRVSGEDPVANAIALARYDAGSFGWDVNDPGHGFVLARSDSPFDAVAAAPLSASGTWGPLLLTDSADTLPHAVRDYLLDVKPGYTTDPTRAFYNHIWVIGDTDAIGVGQQGEVDELAELAKIGER